MTRRIAATAIACLVALACGRTARAEPAKVPPEVARLYQQTPVIELVTMGVGALIWERHGHIALCVRYDDPRDHVCYNYGVGDFGHPATMAWGFLRATGAFWVAKALFEDTLWIYHHTDRTIWIQPLPLTAAQKQQVIAKLEHDILVPNRYYAYDHFLDNCTTRVRDVIDEAIGGKLAALTGPPDDRTFRDLAREGFYGMTLPLLATDIAMGRATDRVPTYYERMFLPQYLREAVTQLWGIQPIAVYTRQGDAPSTDPASGRGWLVLVILVLTAPAWLGRWTGRLPRGSMAIAVVPYVVLGCAMWFTAIISPLGYVRWNELCLVVLPLDVLLLVLPAAARRRYARGRLAMLAAIGVLSLVGVLKQPLLSVGLWPLIPLAVTGFWPERTARGGLVGTLSAGPANAAPRAANQRR